MGTIKEGQNRFLVAVGLFSMNNPVGGVYSKDNGEIDSDASLRTLDVVQK